jgi:chloride channel 3/4/5
MSLRKSRSITGLFQQPEVDPQDEEAPSGPMSGPSSIAWRRQRLLNIGANEEAASESSPLRARDRLHSASYGTLPGRGTHVAPRGRKPPPSLPPLSARHSRLISSSTPASPQGSHSPMGFSFRDLRGEASTYFRGAAQHRISAYDAPTVKDPHVSSSHLPTLVASGGAGVNPGMDVTANGIRVWYSSFTSVDWLHDAIKDAVRRTRLRRRKSVRGKFRLILDRSLGWIIVSVVGFLTAIAAFLVVRSEQLLFDLKEGYCREGWWKARRFCCPTQSEDVMNAYVQLSGFSRTWNATEETCDGWRTWAEVFGSMAENRGKIVGFKAEMVEYVAYACIAVRSIHTGACILTTNQSTQLTLATLSCLLTIYLTASDTFVTRKDSGVLSADYAPKAEDVRGAQTEAPRRVMFYVCNPSAYFAHC